MAAKMNSEGAKTLSRNVINYNGKKILKTLGLFGANASGKSNIIKAIKSCIQIILDSHQFNEGTIFNVFPFKFDEYVNKPSVFSIDFVQDGIEYEYSFTLNSKEILKESLFYYPNGRRAKIFIRDETQSSNKMEIYNFSDGIITRPFDVALNTSKKTLFLSRASQMDRELCKKLYRFFLQDFLLGFAPLDFRTLGFSITNQLFTKNKDFILHALSICDSDISNIKIIYEKQKFPVLPQNNAVFISSPAAPTYDTFRFETYHKNNPDISFDLFSEESAGTTQLFSMLFFLLDVINNGKTFMLDEFDLSLHAKLAEFIIDLFHAGSSSQFVFTSHNTGLINVKRFRRDQILFTNKREDGSTELYSLYDHKDFRENMDAEKGYLQGRFDAIPVIDNSVSAMKLLLNNNETA